MFTHTLRRCMKREEGQALVLACLTMLIVATAVITQANAQLATLVEKATGVSTKIKTTTVTLTQSKAAVVPLSLYSSHCA